jgi:uncharacterized membrane protein
MAVAVGALAFAPVAWYGLASSGTAGLVSAINVALILAGLFVATGPTNGSDHHGHASA